MVADDVERAADFPDSALYGGAGWTKLPPAMVDRVRAELKSIREAPTPTGPTDWD